MFLLTFFFYQLTLSWIRDGRILVFDSVGARRNFCSWHTLSLDCPSRRKHTTNDLLKRQWIEIGDEAPSILSFLTMSGVSDHKVQLFRLCHLIHLKIVRSASRGEKSWTSSSKKQLLTYENQIPFIVDHSSHIVLNYGSSSFTPKLTIVLPTVPSLCRTSHCLNKHESSKPNRLGLILPW